MKLWTKKYWLCTLTALCTLIFAGCSTATTTSQMTTQETTVEKAETLDGTWELVDAPSTLQKSFLMRGSNAKVYGHALEDFADFKPQLVISGDGAEFKYSLDYTAFLDHLYEVEGNGTKKKEEYVKDFINKLRNNTLRFKVTKMSVNASKPKYDYTLAGGKVDESNQTITFQETPSILTIYSFGTTNLVLDPMTYKYEWNGNTLVLTAEGKTEKGTETIMKMTFKRVNE